MTGDTATQKDKGDTQVRFFFYGHAAKRMIERRIPTDLVKEVVLLGEMIVDYPDERPFPSRLILGWDGKRPIHVVSAKNESEDIEYIITVSEPDLSQWEAGYRWRKKA